MASNEKRLPLLAHLAELRTRLLRSVIAIVITTAVSFVFAEQIFAILTYRSELLRPVFEVLTNRFHLVATPDISLIFIDLTEMIGTYFRVALACGIILAMPYWIFEVVMFVLPALKPREKRYVYLIFPWVLMMFLFGVVFSYFILMPPALRFLFTFGTDIASPLIKIGNYISVVTRLMLVTGLIFELPVVTSFLARLGIVSHRWLAGKRKIAVIGAFVIAAIVTPTFDPINQSLVAVPIIVLYELSIWLAWLIQRQKSRAST